MISCFLGCINTDLSKSLKRYQNKSNVQLLKNKSFKGLGKIQIGDKSSRRIPFSYIIKNDSSLIYIRDVFGRSIFLIGISKNTILLKDIRKNKMIDKKNLNINWVIFQNEYLSFLNKLFNHRLEEPYLNDNLNIQYDSISYIFRQIEEVVPLNLFNDLKSNDSINFILTLENNKINDKSFDYLKIWKNLEN